MDGRPEGELTLRGLHFMVDALRAVYAARFTASPVYISWFTAEPVYAPQFTFHGLRLCRFTLCGLKGFRLYKSPNRKIGEYNSDFYF